MTQGQYHPLISRTFGAQSNSGSPISNIQPTGPIDLGSNSDEVTFILACFGAKGAPTAWSLGAKFQYCLPSDDGYQYQRDVWFDLQPENIETNIVEGVGFYAGAHAKPAGGGFGLIADESDTASSAAPIIVQRTIRHFGMRVRVVLDVQHTGGVTPGVYVDLGYFRKGS